MSAPPPSPYTDPDTARALLDDVCSSALRLLAESPRAPRSLRLRLGEVSMDLEFPEGITAAAVAVPVEPPKAAAAADTAAPGRRITAHTVGVFYRSPDPQSDPFVSPGDSVVVGQQVGIIEAMKTMLPVESDAVGRIVEVLAENGRSVEFGDPLFLVEPIGE